MVVYTDGSNVLLVKGNTDKHWTLPDSALHYPLAWKRRDAKWTAGRLLRLVTYGVVAETATATETVEVTSDVFGLDNYKCVTVTVDAGTFASTTACISRVHKHVQKLVLNDGAGGPAHTYSSTYSYTPHAISIQTATKSASVASVHCLHAVIH